MSSGPAGGRARAAQPQASPSTQARAATPLWLRGALVVVGIAGTLFLGRQVLSTAIAKSDAPTRPDVALTWRPQDSAALVAEADRDLAIAKSQGDVAHVRSLAAQALNRSPVEVGAVRLLALATERQGDASRAAQLMMIAGRRSARDGPAQAWLFDYWFKRGDWARAYTHADLLLRTHPQVTKQLDPSLASAAAADPEARRQLESRLAQGPFWRNAFLSDLAQSNPDPGLLLALVTDLDRSGAKLSDEELGDVLNPLVQRHLYDEAYLAWTQSLPPKALSHLANIYDPDFEGAAGPPPFNWAFHQPNGGAVEIAKAPHGRSHVLAVHLYEAPTQPLAVQLLNLPPGHYALAGQSLSDAGGSTGMEWTVRCEGGAVTARISPAGAAGQWTRAAADFDVPDNGCPAQWLELKTIAGASFQGGGVWWDNLSINRAPT